MRIGLPVSSRSDFPSGLFAGVEGHVGTRAGATTSKVGFGMNSVMVFAHDQLLAALDLDEPEEVRGAPRGGAG